MRELPEWIPDDDDIYLALSDDLDRRIGPPKEKGFLAVDELIRRAGLCAQIAVLEEVVEELNGFSWAQLKIAALRKEIEQ